MRLWYIIGNDILDVHLPKLLLHSGSSPQVLRPIWTPTTTPPTTHSPTWWRTTAEIHSMSSSQSRSWELSVTLGFSIRNGSREHTFPNVCMWSRSKFWCRFSLSPQICRTLLKCWFVKRFPITSPRFVDFSLIGSICATSLLWDGGQVQGQDNLVSHHRPRGSMAGPGGHWAAVLFLGETPFLVGHIWGWVKTYCFVVHEWYQGYDL